MSRLKLVVAGKLPPAVDQKLLERAVDLISQSTSGRRSTDDDQRIINLKLVDDGEIQALNKKYAGIDKPTDVLSFHYGEAGELGDIAISYQTAQRQADQAGTTLETEINLLLIHGCLHLLGYDHATGGDQTTMDQLQAEIMQQLGLKYRNFRWDLSEV